MSGEFDRDPQEILLGRQPILDRTEDLYGFELLFRSWASGNGALGQDAPSTAAVILNAFTELGLQRVLGRHKGFINLTAEDLLSDMTELLPKDQVVLEVLETVQVDDEIVRRCAELKRMGFGLALDDVTDLDLLNPSLLAMVDVVKLDVLAIGFEALPDVARRLARHDVDVLAEKVEERLQFERCLKLGCDLFQGYYFARPQILHGKRVPPSTLNLLRLLALVASDADTHVLEEGIKREPHLAYNLLRMVNSVVVGLPHRIGSLRHCITLLGRRQIQRFVQLLVYNSVPESGAAGRPLMHLAATRGKLLELVAAIERPDDAEYQERAFMTGILSLLDTLLAVPFAEIAQSLSLEDGIQQALVARRGELGRLLCVAERLEDGDDAALTDLLEGIDGLERNALSQAEVEAIGWASAVCDPTQGANVR